MLEKGVYSTSARLQSFITSSQKYNVKWQHISGKLKTPLIEAADFASRNPVECQSQNCKICELSKYPDESFATIGNLKTAVNSPIVESKGAWIQIQSSCKDLRRVVTHLRGGTAPKKKERNINDIRLLLRKASLNKHGLLVVKTTLPYETKPSDLIVIPRGYSESILTLLHHKYLDNDVGAHQNVSQLIESTKRKFFIFELNKIAQKVVEDCKLCSSRKRLPKDLVTFDTGTKAEIPGTFFNADVLNIQKRKILVIRDNLTSFTQTKMIPNEQKDSLRDALIEVIYRLKPNLECVVRVDCHPSFQSLMKDKLLKRYGILLELGNAKNPNKNGVAEKAIQELEHELKKENPNNESLTEILLSKATYNLNNKIRFTKRSAKELWFKRDQNTGQDLNIADKDLAEIQYGRRLKDNSVKSMCNSKPKQSTIKPGNIVVIRSELDKTRGRDSYLVIKIEDNIATCIKTNGRSKGTPYKVKVEDLFTIIDPDKQVGSLVNSETESSDSDHEHFRDESIEANNEHSNEQEDYVSESSLEAPRASKRTRSRIDYKILNNTGKRVQVCKVEEHCSFCFKSKYRHYQHSSQYCREANRARSLVKNRVSQNVIKSDSSSESEEENPINETLQKVAWVNQIAREIIIKTRNICSEGLQLNEYHSLAWDDFENSNEDYQQMQEENDLLLDRDHLLSWVNEFSSGGEDFILSEGEDFLADDRSSRTGSDDNWSVQTARKCAQLSSNRRRSVSVTENYFEVPDISDALPDVEEELSPYRPSSMPLLRRWAVIRRKGHVH